VAPLPFTNLKQAAIVMATFAYNAANADQKIPRPTK
jgi:hypothetical protein